MNELIPDNTEKQGCVLSCYGSGAPDMLDEAPVFFWKTYGFTGKQQAYHLAVSSTPEGIRDAKGDVWDTGWVESSEDQQVLWSGGSLESNRDYYCSVRIRDSKGNESQFSDPIRFSTGFLHESDWEASWICSAGNKANPIFRREFNLKGVLQRARLFICGLGYYEAYINGQKIGENLLSPSWTDYTKRVCYIAHDVTNLLAANNAIGVLLGNGWYANVNNTPRPAFIAQLMLEYADGGAEKIVTALNNDWYSHIEGPLRKSSIYIGEVYDARKEKSGWAEFGFDMTNESNGLWQPVLEAEPPAGKLVPMVEEPIRAVGELAPVSLTRLRDGAIVADFGQNIAGVVRLRFRAPAGTSINLRYAELIHQDGTLNTDNLRTAQQADEYITRGGGEEYMPRFTYHGFRYAEIRGLEDLKPEDIRAVVVRNSVPVRGSFNCADELLNRIQTICVWTESNNLHSVPTDCPQRDERLGWLNDLTVRAEEAVYNFDLSRFYRKFLVDIADEQGPKTGAITDVAPYCIFGGQPADGVSSSYLILPWLLYMHHGDRQVLERHYGGLAAWTDYLKRNSTNGIVNNSYYGDWAAPIGETVRDSLGNGAVSAITPSRLMSTGFLHLNARLMGNMARALGKGKDAEDYDALAESTGEALNQNFLNKEKAWYGTNSQAANSFMLYLGIVPGEYRNGVVDNLVKDIREHDTHLTTGNLCTRYIFDALSDNGHIDLAYELAAQTTYPSWGYMLSKGATTTWERWEYVESGPLLEMASHDHAMYSSISGWFYSYLLGIRPLEPGFNSFSFKPYIPKALSGARGTIKSVKGDIEAGWEQSGASVRLAVTVPFNSRCRLVLPRGKTAVVNGASQGISNSGGEAHILLEPGRYEIING